MYNFQSTSFSASVLNAIKKSNENDFSKNLLLPFFSEWLCRSFTITDGKGLVAVHCEISASVVELAVLLTGLRVFSTDLDISLTSEKREGDDEYSIRKLCKCLGIYRISDQRASNPEAKTVSVEDCKQIHEQVRPYLRRLFIEIQDQLFIFNKSVYEKHLDTLPRRQNSIQGFDYCLNGEGNVEFSRFFHLERGYCCGSGCKNCPF